jgi:hypothetical protein
MKLRISKHKWPIWNITTKKYVSYVYLDFDVMHNDVI